MAKVYHERLVRLFRLYLVVGGMPEAVQTYIDTKGIRKVVSVQKKILLNYREVKCGKHYERHHALTHLVSDADSRIGEALVFDADAFKEKGGISYLPIYMAMFLEPPQLPEKMIYEIGDPL